jgi:threonyl-tRNA synthetase
MPKKNLAVQFHSITFSVARCNEYVGRNVKCPLFCPILTNKLKSLTNLEFSLPQFTNNHSAAFHLLVRTNVTN